MGQDHRQHSGRKKGSARGMNPVLLQEIRDPKDNMKHNPSHEERDGEEGIASETRV
jgi:hypothetical protein